MSVLMGGCFCLHAKHISVSALAFTFSFLIFGLPGDGVLGSVLSFFTGLFNFNVIAPSNLWHYKCIK